MVTGSPTDVRVQRQCCLNEPLGVWLENDLNNWKWRLSLTDKCLFMNECKQWRLYIAPCDKRRQVEHPLYKLGEWVSHLPGD